jgi:long-chain acyl-CoA synthetase
VLEQFERMSGAVLYEGYGMTETTSLATTTPTLSKRKPGSIGLPVTGTSCKIVDLKTGDRELPVGEAGELCVRGPQVMKGYWNRPQETAAAMRDGWLYTGDVARMDEDGYFTIVQRKKDMIIVSGFNVYPTEIEDVLFTHPAVKEVAVIGVPCAYRGEAVKAFIIPKEGVPAEAGELIEYCRVRLARFKVPSFIEFVESLPKSAIGKVLEANCRTRKRPGAIRSDPGVNGLGSDERSVVATSRYLTILKGAIKCLAKPKPLTNLPAARGTRRREARVRNPRRQRSGSNR